MVIKFTCEHCKKPLKVPDRLAGREGPCPVCKKKLKVPVTSVVAAPPPSKKSSASASNEEGIISKDKAEEIAAAALADETEVEAPIAGDVTFNCEHCDEPITVSIELAGKRTPCPECTRIVRVPEPQKKEAADWRKADQNLPAGAALAQQQEAPEGAWSAAGTRRVSTEALEEAGALPDQREPTGTLTWIKRGLYASAGLAALILGVVLMIDWFSAGRQAAAIEKALASVSADEQEKHKLRIDQVAAVHRAAAYFYLHSSDEGKAKADGGDSKGARNQFLLARAHAVGKAPGTKARPARQDEVPLFLIDLARGQVDLGGGETEVQAQKRLPWEDVTRDASVTLSLVENAADLKIEGVRRVARKLIEKDQPSSAVTLAAQAVPQMGLRGVAGALQNNPVNTDGLDAMSIVGLELLRAGKPELAAQVLKSVMDALPKPDPKAIQANPQAAFVPLPPVSIELATLCVALGKSTAPLHSGGKEALARLQVAEAAGRAWKKEAVAATISDAKLIPDVTLRAEALVAIAEATENPAAIDAALSGLKAAQAELQKNNEKRTINRPRTLSVRLAEAALRAKVDEKVVEQIASTCAQAEWGAWIQLELARRRLANAKDEVLLSTLDVIAKKTTLAYDVALVELARHNQKKGGDVKEMVEGWNDQQKPLGYAGIAWGLAEK